MVNFIAFLSIIQAVTCSVSPGTCGQVQDELV
jgi:hypothetical protein